MLVIPAIDLYDGKVVRLTKGGLSSLKIYSDNPLKIAQHWKKAGAKLLHIVDLSAAFGEGDNLDVIKDIIKKVSLKIQVGGGIRDLDKAKELISLGAERIVIGTKAIDENFLDSLIGAIGKERLALAADVINSNLAIEGWRKETKLKALDFIAGLVLKGIKWIIYTDTLRDGTLKGINFNKIRKLSIFKGVNIIISGGVSSPEDIKNLKKEVPFVWGVIVGKALYERKIDILNIDIDNS
ncbi:MAG: 1-(5-phosphoribosyl)-5-[(5-phosphoribosylamino)methylideneamino]imidazole-4-carboxamide isomerase [Candidatus Omnitrophica bacterium]|jgi:phosphoribosylformimino-5-aminoimidazole carboxamide ribotide isomerase|nr:1-(5-phosphoribosyl)-5-[(5-phosphoribosylamino)methylideneamino]imidazole-4-carboxamide isomerase [Candidatus Omnitrophota bacterium]